MFVEWNDRALAAVNNEPVGKGRYSYQTHASLVGMVYSLVSHALLSAIQSIHWYNLVTIQSCQPYSLVSHTVWSVIQWTVIQSCQLYSLVSHTVWPAIQTCQPYSLVSHTDLSATQSGQPYSLVLPAIQSCPTCNVEMRPVVNLVKRWWFRWLWPVCSLQIVMLPTLTQCWIVSKELLSMDNFQSLLWHWIPDVVLIIWITETGSFLKFLK